MENISQRYQKTSSADLAKELDIKNVFDIPRISKIVLNMGVKDALSDKKNIEKAIEVLGQITGQKPKITKAKKAISTFLALVIFGF